MFDDMLESTNEKKKTNKGWGFVLSGDRAGRDPCRPDLDSLDLHRGAAEGDALDFADRPTASSATASSAGGRKDCRQAGGALDQSGKLMQPRAIPKEVAVFKEAELPPDVINHVGQTGGVFGGIPGQGMVACHGTATAEADGSDPRQAGR